jgi:hypothetical protein
LTNGAKTNEPTPFEKAIFSHMILSNKIHNELPDPAITIPVAMPFFLSK